MWFLKVANSDIIAELNMPLDELPDNIVAGIYGINILEHISNLFGLLS
jgi:hypothetical protein